MSEIEMYAQRLRLSNILRESALLSAITALNLSPGSQGLDAGCGIGLHTARLAQAIGSHGRVTGLDLLPDFLATAGEYAEQLGLSSQIAFRQGDIRHLPFDDDSFDWAWSADTVYAGPVGDPFEITSELARVVKPGDRVALFWSAQRLLPGYPLLEARLDAGFAHTAPYLHGIAPEQQYTRALGWLRRAGLVDLAARTFVADIHAPLDRGRREALGMTVAMLWAGAKAGLSDEDRALFERITRPGSPDCVLDCPDYWGFLTYTLYQGTVPE